MLLAAARCIISSSDQSFTVMIDPYGDSKNTGHEIDDTFERAITLECAQELKKQLNKSCPSIRVVLTRAPGESVQPLQNASFSNKLQANFYLSLSFYSQQDIPSDISFFYYLENQTDLWHKYNSLCFYHVDNAYLINLKLSKLIGEAFLSSFKQKPISSVFVPLGLFACPYKQLTGVKAPSIAIEAGLQKKDDWKYLIQPLISCIESIEKSDVE
jgi:N-acetylmuramoyl-L-alanine amidase